MDLNDFNNLTGSIDSFLSIQTNVAEKFKSLTKKLYDFTKKCEKNGIKSDALPELVIDEFDDEQVWQELELQNNPSLDHFIKNIALIGSKKNIKLGLSTVSNHGKDNELTKVQETDSENFASPESESEIEEPKPALRTKVIQQPKRMKLKTSIRTSVVDDKFFKLSELEEFLNQEDRNYEKAEQKNHSDEDSDEESIDLFADIPSEDDAISSDEEEEEKEKTKAAREATYEDFFDPPVASDEDVTMEDEEEKQEVTDEESNLESEDYDIRDADVTGHGKTVKRQLVDTDESEGEDVRDILGKGADRGDQKLQKSSFEAQQERLKKQIKEFEESNLQEKPWPLLGEVSADIRPENSALETFVHFDHATQPAPVITEETTTTLEEKIIQRIRDKAWDSVERKIKPKEEPFEYRRRVVLEQEKSKLSLAEVYEKEYLKQQQKEKEDKELPEHTAIKTMMTSLFTKLDALSNFHFVPKPPRPEIKIVNNLPAITVEDVAPVSTSDAALLAPEEIKEKSKGVIKGATEKTSTDRKRERRLKKLRQKEKFKAKEKRNQLQSAKQLKKKKEKNQEKTLKSSKDFFAKLQDEVTNQVQEKRRSKKKGKDSIVSTVKLKL